MCLLLCIKSRQYLQESWQTECSVIDAAASFSSLTSNYSPTGNFLTQNISNIVTTVGICLMAFASWQFTLSEPDCCNDSNSTIDCSKLHKYLLMTDANMHISPPLTMFLAIAGLMVRYMYRYTHSNRCASLYCASFLQLCAIGYGHTNTIQSVFVADQFEEGQVREIDLLSMTSSLINLMIQSAAKEKSFSWYYLFCNVGTLFGEFGMPILRQSVGYVISLLTVVGKDQPTSCVGHHHHPLLTP